MAKQSINIGSSPNDGNGDTLRNGATKVNDNFDELYAALGNGTDLSVGLGKTVISVVTDTGNVGIGSTIPKTTLDVLGNVSVSGVITASSFSGSLVGIATTALTSNYSQVSGISTNVIGGISSVTRLSVSGVSTFTSGPVLIGSGTSTGTASQTLQVTGGVYVSSNVGIGITRPTSLLTVSGNTLISGIVTALSFSGSLNGNDASLTRLSVSGISTFTTGPVLIGSGTSTGTVSQTLQVTGGAYISSNVGVGTTRPTALLHIAPGGTSANSSPIKLTSGSLLTSPEDGTIEYDGKVHYSTPSSTTGRGVIPSILFTSGTNTFANVGTAQVVFPSTNDVLTVVDATTYMVEGSIYIDQASLNTRSLGFSIKGGGSATFTSTALQVLSTKDTDLSTNSPLLTLVTTETNTTVTTSNANRYILLKISGLIRINVGGTINPTIIFNSAPGAVPTGSSNNYLYLYPIGTNTVDKIGSWS
jgi:predicted TIM-barrel enzyme